MEIQEVELNNDGKVEELPLEAKNKIEFCEYNEKLPSIPLKFMCVPFNVSNIQKNKRDEIFESYKAFIACGNEIEEESDVWRSIVSLAQEDKSLDALRNIIGVEFTTIYSKFMGRYQFRIQNWHASPDAKYALIVRSYFKNAQLILVDGYCDKGVKDEVAKFIRSQGSEEEQKAFAERVVLIERHDLGDGVVDKDGTEALAKLLPKGNVIKGNDYAALSKKARELYVKVFQSVLQGDVIYYLDPKDGDKEGALGVTKDEFEELLNKANDNQVDLPFEGGKHIKIKKNKFRKLFDKVKENKGKVAGGIFSLIGVGLLRRVVLGGNETNEKTKNVKDLKKLIDLENADEFPNRKDGNSAPN